jgi:hypothetical protein
MLVNFHQAARHAAKIHRLKIFPRQFRVEARGV